MEAKRGPGQPRKRPTRTIAVRIPDKYYIHLKKELNKVARDYISKQDQKETKQKTK